MKPSSHSVDKLQYYRSNKEKFLKLESTSFLLWCLLFSATLFSFYILYSPGGAKFQIKQDYDRRNSSLTRPQAVNIADCDLFNGRWIPDEKGPVYSNFSCPVIPYKTNCFLHGRNDKEFLYWRWKPERCELPHFQSKTFLSIVRGKTMAFIGDSLARNQMESLLCLLSSEETPEDVYRDEEDGYGSRIWRFPNHNFTVMILWSQFLVTASEKILNGSSTGGYDLYLDKVNVKWSEKLPSIDYAIFSDAHWFLRPNYLYEGGNLIGCVYCQEENITKLSPGFAIRAAFRTALRYVNNCKDCSGIITLLRTYSPAHFEQGAWNTGGYCNRTRPLAEEDIDTGGSGWEFRDIQMEEIERARKEGEERGKLFEVIDISKAMEMRVDGHPGVHWGNKWMKGYSDCIHWCLPGPVDTWNELLLELLARLTPSAAH